MNDLRDSLMNISRAINNDSRLNWINAGGCGVFAAIVAKQFNLPSDCIRWYFVGKDMHHIAHVVIKLSDGTEYDSNGFNKNVFRSYNNKMVNYSYLATTLRKLGLWNNRFNRTKLTPIISEIVKKEAKRYYEAT